MSAGTELEFVKEECGDVLYYAHILMFYHINYKVLSECFEDGSRNMPSKVIGLLEELTDEHYWSGMCPTRDHDVRKKNNARNPEISPFIRRLEAGSEQRNRGTALIVGAIKKRFFQYASFDNEKWHSLPEALRALVFSITPCVDGLNGNDIMLGNMQKRRYRFPRAFPPSLRQP
jgi:hypothetical protein